VIGVDLYFISKCVNGVDVECKRLIELLEKGDSDLCMSVKEVFKSLAWSEGWCANYDRVVKDNNSECSVGIIRKDRDGVVNDDGSCYYCPLFIPYYVLSVINGVCSGENTVDDVKTVLRMRFMELFLPKSLGGGRSD